MVGILNSVMGVALITVVMETEAYIAYMPRSLGVTDDPCGPTLDAMRAAGESGLPNSPYIPPPRPGASDYVSAPTGGIYNTAPSDPYLRAYPNTPPNSDLGALGTARASGSTGLGTSETGSKPGVQATHLPGVVHRVSGNVFSASIVPNNPPSSSGNVNTVIGSSDPTKSGSNQQPGRATPGVRESQPRTSSGPSSGSFNPAAGSGDSVPKRVDARPQDTNNQRSWINSGTPNSNIPTISFSVSGGAQTSSSIRRQKRVKRQVAHNPGGYNNAGAYNHGGYNTAGAYNIGGYHTAGGYNPNHAAMLDYDPPEYYYVPGGRQPYGAPGGAPGGLMVNPDGPDMPYGGYPMQGGYPPSGGIMYASGQPYSHYGPGPASGPVPYGLNPDMPDMLYSGYYGAPIDPHTAAMLDLDMPPGMPPPPPPGPAYPPPYPQYGPGRPPMDALLAPPPQLPIPNIPPMDLPHNPFRSSRPPVSPGVRATGSSMRGPPYDWYGPDGRQNTDPGISATNPSGSGQPNPRFRQFNRGNPGDLQDFSKTRPMFNTANAQEAASQNDPSLPADNGGPFLRQGISRTGRKIVAGAVRGSRARSRGGLRSSNSQAAANSQQNQVASWTVTSIPPLAVSPGVSNFKPTTAPGADAVRPSEYDVNTAYGRVGSQPRAMPAPQTGVGAQGVSSTNNGSGTGSRPRSGTSIGRGDLSASLGNTNDPTDSSGVGAARLGSAGVGIDRGGIGHDDKVSGRGPAGEGTVSNVNLGTRDTVTVGIAANVRGAANAATPNSIGSGLEGRSGTGVSAIAGAIRSRGSGTRPGYGSGVHRGNNAGLETGVGAAGQQSSNGTAEQFISKVNFQPGPADLANGKHSPAQRTAPEYGPIPWVAEPLPVNSFLQNQQAQPSNQDPYQAYQQPQYDPYSYLSQDPYYQYYSYRQDPFYLAQNDPWNFWGYEQPFGGPYYYPPYRTSNANQGRPSSDPHLWPGSEASSSSTTSLSGQGTVSGSSQGQATISAQQTASLNPKLTLVANGKPPRGANGASAPEPHGKITIVRAPDQSRTPRGNGGLVSQPTSGPGSSPPVDSRPGRAGLPEASPIPQGPHSPYVQGPFSPYPHHPSAASQQNPYGSSPQDPLASAYQPYANVDIYAVPQEPRSCYCELASECNMEATTAGAHYARQCDGSGNFVCCCRR